MCNSWRPLLPNTNIYLMNGSRLPDLNLNKFDEFIIKLKNVHIFNMEIVVVFFLFILGKQEHILKILKDFFFLLYKYTFII